MRESVKISGLQMVVTHDVARNESRIVRGIEQASEQGSQFLVTPEGALSGYYAAFDREEVASATDRLAARAREVGIGLLLGTCYKEAEESGEHCYNQVRVYTPSGDYLGYHAKILRCSSLSHPGTGEMTDYVQGTLRTFDWDGMRFGVLICNDLWATPGHTIMPNPYLPWKLWQMGAQVIFHAVNSGHHWRNRAFHEASVELWSHALQVPILGVDALSNPEEPISAPSGLVSPDGTRTPLVPDLGEQFFTCEIALPRRDAPRRLGTCGTPAGRVLGLN
ncbi:carbon-nitrogen hydrolase family protein [Chloroflexota bacterium]